MANEIGGDTTTIANTGSADVNMAGKLGEVAKSGVENIPVAIVSSAFGLKGAIGKDWFANAGLNGGSLLPQLNNNIIKNVIQSSATALQNASLGKMVEGKNKNGMSSLLDSGKK